MHAADVKKTGEGADVTEVTDTDTEDGKKSAEILATVCATKASQMPHFQVSHSMLKNGKNTETHVTRSKTI